MGLGGFGGPAPPPPAVPGPHGCPVPTSASRATLVWHGAGLAPWVGKGLEPSHPKLAQNPKHSAPTQRRGRGGSRAALSPSSPFARVRAGPSQPPSPPGTGPPLAPGMGPGSCAKALCPPPAAGLSAPRARCLPRAVAALPAWERISPSLPKGLWLLLQIKWKWGIWGLQGQAGEGGTRHSCRHPPGCTPTHSPCQRWGN